MKQAKKPIFLNQKGFTLKPKRPKAKGITKMLEQETTEVETTEVETTEVETTAVETTAVETTAVETTAVETTEVETTEVEKPLEVKANISLDAMKLLAMFQDLGIDESKLNPEQKALIDNAKQSIEAGKKAALLERDKKQLEARLLSLLEDNFNEDNINDFSIYTDLSLEYTYSKMNHYISLSKILGKNILSDSHRIEIFVNRILEKAVNEHGQVTQEAKYETKLTSYPFQASYKLEKIFMNYMAINDQDNSKAIIRDFLYKDFSSQDIDLVYNLDSDRNNFRIFLQEYSELSLAKGYGLDAKIVVTVSYDDESKESSFDFSITYDGTAAGPSTKGRKKGKQTKVPGYNSNQEYALAKFINAPGDNRIKSLYNQFDQGFKHWNLSKELVEAEKLLPESERLYTNAKNSK